MATTTFYICTNDPQKFPTTAELFSRTEHLDKKIKAGTASTGDFAELKRLAQLFSRQNKYSESSFCKKLQVKFLFQTYKKIADGNNAAAELEFVHDEAVDLLVYAESKKVASASIYKIFFRVKAELAYIKRVKGFYEDAIALEKCAERIYNKALLRFPTYEKFAITPFQNI